VASREEHLDLARILLLAFADRQDLLGDGKPQGFRVDAVQIEELFRRANELTIPPSPTSCLVLPRLLRGKRLWPLLSIFFLRPAGQPVQRPALELASLEIFLVPEGEEAGEPHRCIGFRFEAPTSYSFDGPQPGSHDYYHMQFVAEPRVAGALPHGIYPLPDRAPAFPLRAADFGSLVLALVVALYGRRALDENNDRSLDIELSSKVRQRLGVAYGELSYW
jgi:hypothetical protein